MTTRNEYIPQSYSHPGETLAEKLDELGMSTKEFSIRTGKPEKTIIAVMKGESSITPDMAVQFENVLRIPANFWLNYQKAFDEYNARVRRQEIIQESTNWARRFPISTLVQKNWIEKKKSIEEQTIQLLNFFSVSDAKAWENYYLNQQLKVAFRISLAHIKESYAISAWLRKGEIQAAELNLVEYSEKIFKESLPELKSLMAKHPENFFDQLQDICLKSGVKVVYTPCLPKAPINGATRWLNDSPLIQLSARYQRNDIFWFTFFHEAGHILLHGKKDIFLEDIEYSDKDIQKEKEADNFAVKWTLSEEQEKEIIASFPLNEKKIVAFAKQFNTHPAMIVGRLRRKKIINFILGKKFIQAISL